MLRWGGREWEARISLGEQGPKRWGNPKGKMDRIDVILNMKFFSMHRHAGTVEIGER